MVRGEQGDPGISSADKGWHAVPQALMKPLEPENVDVPIGGSFDVAHAHRDVINSFELHEMLDRMYIIYRIAETIKVERVVLNALATAGAGFRLDPVVAASDKNYASADFFRDGICLSSTVTVRVHEHLTRNSAQKSAINCR